MPLLLLAFAACGPEDPVDPPDPAPTDPVTDPTEPVDPSPWDYTGGNDGDGPIDLDRLGVALDQAILEVLTYDARDVLTPYVDIYNTSSSPFCPMDVDDGYGNFYWVGYCGTPDGAYFDGYLSHYVYDDFESDGLILNGDLISGVITLTDSAGFKLDSEGEAQWLDGLTVDGSTRYVASYLNGGFGWDGANGGWLADGQKSVGLSLTGIAIPIIDAKIVIVSGAVTTRLGDDLFAVEFSDPNLVNAGAGSACTLEPGGSIAVRDVQGRWIDIDFHGPILDVTDGDAARCDGCGDASVLGEPLGEVCADFSPWFAWEAIQ